MTTSLDLSNPYALPFAGPDFAQIILEPLDIPSKGLVLFAVNNNPDVTNASGGSHWSLLAYTPHSKALRHYDSCRGMNRNTSLGLYKALKPLLIPETELVEERCPQQENDFDCGMYVLAIADILCQRYSAGGIGSVLDFEIKPEEVNAATLKQMRAEVHSLVMTKAEKR